MMMMMMMIIIITTTTCFTVSCDFEYSFIDHIYIAQGIVILMNLHIVIKNMCKPY